MRRKKRNKTTHCPAHVYPPFCTTVVTGRYFSLTLAGIDAPTMEMTARTVLAPLGS
jgi:hypothetical protein